MKFAWDILKKCSGKFLGKFGIFYYIVFMGKEYCVYIHRKKDDGEIFYVGIGLPKRPYDVKKRNKFWKYVVNKHGYNVEILYDGLSWKSARDIEIQLIQKYGRRDLDEGTLVNLTDGGEGAYGIIQSESSKKKRSKSLKEFYSNGVDPPMLGKHHSDESKRRMSNSNKETHKGENHPRSKLSQSDVNYIRENYIKGDKIYGVIGMSKKFNVSKGQISKIINKKRWG